jgi:hypothetical protein
VKRARRRTGRAARLDAAVVAEVAPVASVVVVV